MPSPCGPLPLVRSQCNARASPKNGPCTTKSISKAPPTAALSPVAAATTPSPSGVMLPIRTTSIYMKKLPIRTTSIYMIKRMPSQWAQGPRGRVPCSQGPDAGSRRFAPPPRTTGAVQQTPASTQSRARARCKAAAHVTHAPCAGPQSGSPRVQQTSTYTLKRLSWTTLSHHVLLPTYPTYSI